MKIMLSSSADIRSVAADYGLSQSALSRRLSIPLRTVQDWMGGRRTPPDYILSMIDFCLANGADFEAKESEL